MGKEVKERLKKLATKIKRCNTNAATWEEKAAGTKEYSGRADPVSKANEAKAHTRTHHCLATHVHTMRITQ